MKTIVLYKSKTGYTKNYANWISETITADICDLNSFNIKNLEKYDTIIFGGGLYASGIYGLKKFLKSYPFIKKKHTIVYGTGASLGNSKDVNNVYNKNFTQEQKENIKFFYFRGGFDYSKLNLKDKILMNLLKIKIKNRRNSQRTSDEKGMLALFNNPMDYTDKDKLIPLFDYITSL